MSPLPGCPTAGKGAEGRSLDRPGESPVSPTPPHRTPASSVPESDIIRLVGEFYARVRADEVLGPIFDGAIDRWPHHLGKLVEFWSSVMLSSGRYKGQPMVAHIRHADHMTPANFERWLGLWRQTTGDVLGPEAAIPFREKAERIAESLQLGVQFHRDRNLPRSGGTTPTS